MQKLRQLLLSIHRKSYPAYKSLKGSYRFQTYTLSIDHVQGDPFASPSNVSVKIPLKASGFPASYYACYETRIALQDYLTRKFYAQIARYNFKAKGSGKSGLLATSHPGQEILERTACEITNTEIIARFEVGFPANGRTINATELEKILFDFLPSCIEAVFYYRNLNAKEVEDVIFLAEDQMYIRKQLPKLGLVGFVANGSVLPRESGVSSRPLKNGIPFTSPSSLAVTLTLPHKGTLTGMGIRKGITLIVGGGYHGKSTLLNALEAGVYNHIAGDGREYVITEDTALKLRAEDGRCIKNVDISLFINDLPNKKDTHTFSTENASGSTSQAANVIEGMEAGSNVFLMDEDTTATNFMVRDTLMQQIITRDKEPITPFLERIRDIYEQAGISTILVAGSSGAYFYAADTILQMDCYQTLDITEKVAQACKHSDAPALSAPNFALPVFQRTIFLSGANTGRTNTRRKNSHGSRNHGEERIKTKTLGKDAFMIDRQTVDLRYVEQLADSEQTAFLAQLLKYVLKHDTSEKSIREVVEMLELRIKNEGLGSILDSSYISCGFALPRSLEIYACFNRYRGDSL